VIYLSIVGNTTNINKYQQISTNIYKYLQMKYETAG